MTALPAGTILDPVETARTAGLRYVDDRRPGLTRRPFRSGFRYVDAAGNPVRDRATIERIRSLVIPPAWTNVWICPLANGHIQAVGRDARGRKQYRYHPRYREFRDRTKYDRLLAVGKALPRIRRRIAADLKSPGMSKEKVLATIVRLLDATCIRIGNDEYARSNHSYGLTTLRNHHASVKGDTVRLRFRAKSGLQQDVTFKHPALARIIKRCQELPGEELFEYRTDSGDYQPIDSADVNEYLRQVAGEELTAKDYRTWHGSVQTLSELMRIGPAESETQIKKNLVEAVKAAAAHLGNRPATCRSYYIHPAVTEAYANRWDPFDHEESRVLPQRRVEAELLALLKRYYRKNHAKAA